ncbi:MAG: CHAT domain-containing protein [Pyrinomonadaceae bacterium]
MNNIKEQNLKLFGLAFVLLLGFQFALGQDQSADLRQLEPNQTLEAEMRGTETHRYKINLRKNEFFQIRVEQKGIDVLLSLVDPKGNELARMDSTNGDKGFEVLSFVSDSQSSLILVVRSFEEKAEKGIYTIRREASRSANAIDKKRVEVERLFVQGVAAIKDQPTVAVEALEKALLGWQELKDDAMSQMTEETIKTIKNNPRKEEISQKRGQFHRLFSEAIEARDKARFSPSLEPYREALNKASQALEISQTLKELAFESLCLSLIADIFDQKGDHRQALKYYERSLQTVRSVKEKTDVTKTIEKQIVKAIGKSYSAQNMYEDALKWFSQALGLYQENEEDEIKGDVFTNIGKNQVRLNMFLQAEESYLKAKQIFERLKLPLELAEVLYELGGCYSQQEHKQAEALNSYLEAEKLFENNLPPNSPQDIRIYNLHFISNTYFKLKDFGKASFYANKLKSLRANIRDPDNALLHYLALGKELYEAGKLDEAVNVYHEALDFLDKNRGANFISGKIEILKALASVYSVMGEKDEGEKYFKQLSELIHSLKSTARLAVLYEDIADGAFNSGHFEKAADYYLRSIRVMMSKESNIELMDYLEIGTRVLNKLGRAQLEIGEISKALHHFRLSLSMRVNFSNKAELAENLHDMMVSFAKLDKKRLAIFFGKQAIKLKQEFRVSLKTLPIETQKSFLKGNRETYEKLIVLLLQEGRVEEAQQCINLYQSQDFYDFGDNRTQLAKELTFTQREKETSTEFQKLEPQAQKFREIVPGLVSILKFRPATQQEKQELDLISASVVQTADKFEDKLRQIEADFSQLPNEKDTPPSVPDVLEMQTTLRELNAATKQKTDALYTLIGSDKFYILLITPDEIKAFESPVKAADLNKKILQFYALLQSPEYVPPKPLGKELYDIIIKPIEEELKGTGAQTLMWSLDGSLRYLPMAALWDGEKYLVERYQNVVFTRTDSGRMTQTVSSNWTGYGFSTTKPHKVIGLDRPLEFLPLDFVKDEMQVFRTKSYPQGLIDGDVFTDAQFNKDFFIATLKQRRPLVHISSHFSFRPGDASQSFLLLGDSHVMTLAEMKERENLFQGVELLTLSACSTAAQFPDANGREIDGFAELAQRLGANSVIASLWQVRDRSTALMMKGFYRNLQIEKLNKAEALRKAQLDLLYGKNGITPTTARKQSEISSRGSSAINDLVVEEKYRIQFTPDKKALFAHPYYWSPFVIFGNWK